MICILQRRCGLAVGRPFVTGEGAEKDSFCAGLFISDSENSKGFEYDENTDDFLCIVHYS